MPRRKIPVSDAALEHQQVAAICFDCNPPERTLAELGSGIGAHRYAHYLSYHSTDALEQHLRATASRFPDPPLGETYEAWLRGVLHGHAAKQRQRESEARRWGKG